MSNDVEHMISLFGRHREAFDACPDLASFAVDAKAPHLARYVGGWADLVYRAGKAHGLDKVPHRALHMPEARALSEIMQDARLMPMLEGGRTIAENEAYYEGRRFIGTRNMQGVPSATMGGKRTYARDWLARGERLRSQSGGRFTSIYANPTPAARAAWESQIGRCDNDGSRDGYDFSLQSFELIQWHDGRTVVIGRAGSVFSMWFAVVDNGAADLLALLSDDDRAAWDADRAAAAKAWPPVPAPTGWWVVKGEDRQTGALGILEPFETRVKAGDANDAKELARLQRYEIANREHVNIFSAVEAA